ncbi:MAG: HAD family hydrolase [Chloroflexi bacterium]|nr:HAD family hydrolase [Chloroflexota bacterium]
MIETVVFDLDGTLRDWEAGISRALAELQPELPEQYRAGLAGRLAEVTERLLVVRREGRVVERRHYWYAVDPLPLWRRALPDAEPAAVEALANRFAELLDAVPFADVHPTLERLREGYALGVLSNGPSPEAALTRMGFTHCFDAIVSAHGGEEKPSPRAFLQALEELGASAEVAAYVGDSITLDVEGALGAGLTAVWLDRYGDAQPPPAGAHRIASLEELPELLLELAD